MATGLDGTFVISWAQTDIDGLASAPRTALSVGASWRWTGDGVRVDGPSGVLLLSAPDGAVDLRRRVARSVQRMIGARVKRDDGADHGEDDEGDLVPFADARFEVTDGRQSWDVTLIETAEPERPLLLFCGAAPPRDRQLWVVWHNLALRPKRADAQQSATICFTPGTAIACDGGPRRVEDLRAGDKVQTKDNGCRELVWTGTRRVTGARLRAMPNLRPVRMVRGALGKGVPDAGLLVSPDHRVVVQGPRAEALFGVPEVLAAARDLVDGRRVFADLSVRRVDYIHLLLPGHEVIFANGVETESYHPLGGALDAVDRARLLAAMPELERDAAEYGGYARRLLSASDAAILMYDAA